MIYVCADDYGLCDILSAHILKCIDEGALNKVSAFVNFDAIDFSKIQDNKKTHVSLHLNLVEGKCIADKTKIDLLADENGIFIHTFMGLFKLNVFKKKKFEAQLYEEIKAQVLYWRGILPKDCPFFIDSHQHTHMIPSVFKVLLNVLDDEKINLKYLRIPAEPIMPYIKTPSLYFTYSAINLIKQWFLKFLWLIDKRYFKNQSIPTAYFFGVLFSGKMDEKRVNKILPQYIKMAEKNNKDIEVLFHPGYIEKSGIDLKNKNISFEKFYFSKDRKTEFDTAMKIVKEG